MPPFVIFLQALVAVEKTLPAELTISFDRDMGSDEIN